MKTFNQDEHFWEHDSIADFWRHHVPAYKSKSIRPFFARFPYEGLPAAAQHIRTISEKRSTNRIGSYVIQDEVSRVRSRLGRSSGGKESVLPSVRLPNRESDGASDKKTRARVPGDVSIRFGVRKTGTGYGGKDKRGDFCLVSAVYANRTLTLFYRSIELIGGFAYDTVLIEHVCKELGIEPKWIEIWAVKAFVFALKGNSNEKLYPKLKRIFREPSLFERERTRILKERSRG